MAARYFFHADDTAKSVYGPVPVETLRRWRTEGRLRDNSRLRAEGGEAFTTAKEVLSAPPLPEPPPAAEAKAEDDLPPLIPAPSRTAASAQPIPVTRLLSDTLGRYGAALRRLWWVALVVFLPLAVLCLKVEAHIDPKTRELAPAYVPVSLTVLVLTSVLFQLGLAFMAVTLHPVPGALSPAERAGFVLKRAVRLLWTRLLGNLLASSLFFIFGFCVAAAGGAPPSPLLRMPVYFFAALSLLATVLLVLRYLPVLLVVLFEEKSGLRALRRSGDLVRFNDGSGLVSRGDFRLVLMLLPAPGIFLCVEFFSALVASHLHLADRLVPVFGAGVFLAACCLAMPLYILLLLSFYIDAAPRVPDETPAPTVVPPKPKP